MTKVAAGITTSLDGYITGPNDGPGRVISQALRAGHVEELSISIAAVALGGEKPLFDDFDETVNLEHPGVLQSPFATHITYRVVR